MFYDTLYDENASCHLALGMGFPECLKGGLEMTPDELLAHGVNQSTTHVDFMIGADDLNIWGNFCRWKRNTNFRKWTMGMGVNCYTILVAW